MNKDISRVSIKTSLYHLLDQSRGPGRIWTDGTKVDVVTL